jgi:hypothetical protein
MKRLHLSFRLQNRAKRSLLLGFLLAPFGFWLTV